MARTLTGQALYEQRVLRAAKYIVDNIARPLTVAEVAKVAARPKTDASTWRS